MHNNKGTKLKKLVQKEGREFLAKVIRTIPFQTEEFKGKSCFISDSAEYKSLNWLETEEIRCNFKRNTKCHYVKLWHLNYFHETLKLLESLNIDAIKNECT